MIASRVGASCCIADADFIVLGKDSFEAGDAQVRRLLDVNCRHSRVSLVLLRQLTARRQH